MHELAVTERIMQIALAHVPPGEALSVTDVYVVVGELSSIVADSVQFYWEVVAQDTAVAHATLHFRRIPPQLTCQTCHHTYTPPRHTAWLCPACGGFHFRITAGEEFYVEAIEVAEGAVSLEL
jgi:hydrogenase nickel incorporation protein HypA/HybF